MSDSGGASESRASHEFQWTCDVRLTLDRKVAHQVPFCFVQPAPEDHLGSLYANQFDDDDDDSNGSGGNGRSSSNGSNGDGTDLARTKRRRLRDASPATSAAESGAAGGITPAHRQSTSSNEGSSAINGSHSSTSSPTTNGSEADMKRARVDRHSEDGQFPSYTQPGASVELEFNGEWLKATVDVAVTAGVRCSFPDGTCTIVPLKDCPKRLRAPLSSSPPPVELLLPEDLRDLAPSQLLEAPRQNQPALASQPQQQQLATSENPPGAHQPAAASIQQDYDATASFQHQSESRNARSENAWL